MTDESGQYSLVLPPGEFVVMGQTRETWPLESDTTQVFGYPPSFYPGVIEPTEAQRVKVGVGQESATSTSRSLPREPPKFGHRPQRRRHTGRQ